MIKYHPHYTAKFQIDGMPSILGPPVEGITGRTPSLMPSASGLPMGSIEGLGSYNPVESLTKVGGAFAAGGPVGAGIAAVPEIYKLFQGLSQARKAKSLAQQRPEYKIPEAQTEALETLRAGAMDPRIPGQTLAQEQLGKASQRNIEAIQQSGASPAEIIAGISNVGSQERGGLQQIGEQAAGAAEQRRAALVQGLGQQAQYQQAQQQYNVLDPYAEDMQAKAALEEGSRQNIHRALKGGASIGIESLPTKAFDKTASQVGKGSSYSSEQVADLLKTLGYK